MDIDSKEGVLIKSEVGVEETEDSLLEHEYYGIEELKSEPTDFRDHISVHPQEEPFSCIFCKLKFEDEDNLEQHMKTHITVIHPYICNECKFKTTEKDSLIEHLKIHRRIQYVCHKCSFKTLWKSFLQAHLKIHNDDEYYCKKCDFKTLRKSSLKSHLRCHYAVKYFCKKERRWLLR